MIKHIVMWKLLEPNKADNAVKIKGMLEDLVGKIDGLLSAEVGIDICIDNDSFDAVLVSTFDSVQSLKAYKVNPLYVAVSTFVKSVRSDRKVVDFEV